MGRIQLLSGLSTGEPFSFQLLNCVATVMEKNGWLHISSSKRNEFLKQTLQVISMSMHFTQKH